MVAQPNKNGDRMTVEEYFTFERSSEFKHEYIDGQIVMMTGGSPNHSLIKIRIPRLLEAQLETGSCRVFDSDMRLYISTTRYTYPDFSIACDPIIGDNDNLINPRVIIEVLSSSTAGYDRGDKFRAYQRIASFGEYLLVSQDKPLIERFTRQPSGLWLLDEAYGLAAAMTLHSVPASLELAEVYRHVPFETEIDDDD